MNKNHQFHLVDPSPWPLIISLSTLNFIYFIVPFFKTKKIILLYLFLLIVLWIMILWWRDIQRESTFQGWHTHSVAKSIKYGMLLFICSEILFFMSFFWSFFHHSLSPAVEIGMHWPPNGISSFNPMHIPLINTIILLSSGVSITWSHAAMLKNNMFDTKKSLMLTIMLALLFSMFQFYEYLQAPFCMSDSVYGSCFFLTTGFHGIHVVIGTLFLIQALTRLNNIYFNCSHHLGMEMAIWYWHFVDVVWLFLYISIYWWGK
uniref:Cytochrome c oxidase subunit 3 n=1 Tax=Melanastera paucipunctata TaxID=2218046 RepID=A0A344A297_9HEMI|nr:cytochrome c oxidase subunit 3 [Diclidophlebia paucipunctata]AWU48888.1 cytochrome c oxidase subunit 3 [Diclidophlebia paucipunctata]